MFILFKDRNASYSDPNYNEVCPRTPHKRVTQMRALLACRELAGDYNKSLKALYVFEHKT